MTCPGIVSSKPCAGAVVLVQVDGSGAPHAICATCRATAEAMGMYVRPILPRGEDRRRDRIHLPGESIGRRLLERRRAQRAHAA